MQKNKIDLKKKKDNLCFSRIKNPELLIDIRNENIEHIKMAKVEEKDNSDFSDILNTMALTSAISALSSLSSETLEFSTIKNKNLLRDYEKIRFKRIS